MRRIELPFEHPTPTLHQKLNELSFQETLYALMIAATAVGTGNTFKEAYNMMEQVCVPALDTLEFVDIVTVDSLINFIVMCAFSLRSLRTNR